MFLWFRFRIWLLLEYVLSHRMILIGKGLMASGPHTLPVLQDEMILLQKKLSLSCMFSWSVVDSPCIGSICTLSYPAVILTEINWERSTGRTRKSEKCRISSWSFKGEITSSRYFWLELGLEETDTEIMWTLVKTDWGHRYGDTAPTDSRKPTFSSHMCVCATSYSKRYVVAYSTNILNEIKTK